MSSRIRRDAKHIFEGFLEVANPDVDGQDPFILQSFPANFKDKEADKLKMVPHFTFPCKLDISTVQNFSFVLTDFDAQWTFGFCRVAPQSQTALVILSKLPWHETFYRVLNHAAEIVAQGSQEQLFAFLEASHTSRVPEGGQMFHVTWQSNGQTEDFTSTTPHQFNLPSIPENRNLTEYFNAVGLQQMLVIFASMLHERRIVITSKKLSRLTACVQAANSLLYPMFWQHIFIPVLPKHLIDFLSAPMPYLIGVPEPVMKRVKSHELGDAVVLDADTNTVQTCYDDLRDLPTEVVANLSRSLKKDDLLGDTLARAYLQAIVHLIGGYRDALGLRQGESITFCEEAFLSSRPSNVRPFLEQILQLQIFRQFVDERLQLLNSGKGMSDEFETEVLKFSEMKNYNQGARIKSHLRREGGAFVKAVQRKANPAVRSAVKSVRDSSKSAFKDLKREMKSLKVNQDGRQDGHRSAPASPTLGRLSDRASSHVLTGGSLARTSTDLNLTGRVLKYEKFEPPPVSSLSASSNSDKSPESETIPRINMELMTELEDVIYRQTSPLGQPPAVNRKLKPVLARQTPPSSTSISDIHNNNKSSFHIKRPVAVVTTNQTLGNAELELDNAQMTTAKHPALTRVMPAPACNSNSGGPDLISLGDTIAASDDDIIFDPLLEKAAPVQNSSTHRPLQRSSINNGGGVVMRPHPGPPTAPHSTSSEDLLREYGLHFDALAIRNSTTTRSSGSDGFVVTQPSHDPFGDLDPFKSGLFNSTTSVAQPQQPFIPMPPPVAPPRSKRQVTTNWTTFE